jgi:SOS-response transcriptional repressor LexA
MMVRRFGKVKGSTRLVSENTEYKPIAIYADMDIEILGIVTAVIHPL